MRPTLTRLSPLALLPLVAVLAGCPKDKKPVAAADTFKVDTTQKVNLDTLKTQLPPASTDTAAPPPPKQVATAPAPAIPDAPSPLMDAVQREQSVSTFCFQEFGQKTDPSLRGSVAMVVTVGSRGITATKVGASNWSSGAGKAVNRCLEQRAKDAWRLEPGQVKPGQYRVPLTFRSA